MFKMTTCWHGSTTLLECLMELRWAAKVCYATNLPVRLLIVKRHAILATDS